MISPEPRRIVTQDIYHAIYNFVAFWAVFHILHLLEQPVIFGIRVIGGILAFIADLLLRTVQQEQKILRIGIIRVPAPLEYLRIALAYFVLKAVVVRTSDHQLDIEFLELFAHPVKT